MWRNNEKVTHAEHKYFHAHVELAAAGNQTFNLASLSQILYRQVILKQEAF